MQIQDSFNNLENQLSQTSNFNISKNHNKSPDNHKEKLKPKIKQVPLNSIDLNEALIAEAFRNQCEGDFEEAYNKLEKASANLFDMLGKLQTSSDFYMKVLPAMRQERELIPQKIVDQFWAENQGLLNQNFEQNTYLQLLMREIDQKKQQTKWSQEDEELLNELCEKNKLCYKSPKEVTARVYRWQPKH